ncbi:MAG: TrmB family transcriptional regulator [Anaerolineales bacterium]|nr:TrmB family transcriptional regulator [Anaerolineales bacterium]
MNNDPIENLIKIGFSEYEAKAYIALLRKSPVTGYELSKLSGVPRSMIYEVAGKLTNRGAAMTLGASGAIKYAAVPAEKYIDKLSREQQELELSLRDQLGSLSSAPDLEYVWNIDGYDNIMSKAIEMINQAQKRIYLALVPDTFPALKNPLKDAVQRNTQVAIYTTGELDFPGCRVIVAEVAETTLDQARGLGLILVIDGKEVLIAEWLADTHARASWATSPLLVFIAEHHLRTDLYLPRILSLLGDQALDIIQEEDRELFAHALESQIDE